MCFVYGSIICLFLLSKELATSELLSAVRMSDLATVQFCLDRGADVNVPTEVVRGNGRNITACSLVDNGGVDTISAPAVVFTAAFSITMPISYFLALFQLIYWYTLLSFNFCTSGRYGTHNCLSQWLRGCCEAPPSKRRRY